MESQLKNIVLEVYSDKRRHSSTSEAKLTTTVQEEEGKNKAREESGSLYESLPSPFDSVSHSRKQYWQKPEHLEELTTLIRSNPDGSDSPHYSPAHDSSHTGSQYLPDSSHSAHPEDLSAGINVLTVNSQQKATVTQNTRASNCGREARRIGHPVPSSSLFTDQLMKSMSDTHRVEELGDIASSLPAFSADDMDINPEDSEFALRHLGDLPYSGGIRNHITDTHRRPNFLYPSSDPVIPDSSVMVESNPGLLYSFSDSSTSNLPSSERRSGVIDSFGITPQLYHNTISKPRPPPLHPVPDRAQANPSHTPVVNGSHAVDGSDAVDGSSSGDTETDDTTDTPSPRKVLDQREHRNNTPLAQEEPTDNADYNDASSRDKTPTPEPVPVSSTSEHIPVTESTGASSCHHLEPAGANIHLSAEDASELIDSTKDELPVAVGVPYFSRMDSDAAETCSVVSVQQLAEDYLMIEPADFDNVTTPLVEGQRKIAVALPLTVKASKPKCVSSPNDPPLKQALREFPSPATPSKQLMTPCKVPAHISISKKCEGRSNSPAAVRTVSVSSDVSESFASLRSAPSLVRPSNFGGHIEGSHSDHERDLEDQLVDEQKAQMYLKGQLETLANEYEAALGDRSGLLSRLSRAEAELAEVTSAVEREKTRKAALIEDGQSATKPVVVAGDNLKEVLAREKKVSSDLQANVAKEKHKSDRLEKDLEGTMQVLGETETALAVLQGKLRSSQVEMEKKSDESEQRLCKLSTLEASYDALEKNKQWLHEQLQDGLKAKLKLQEELREAKVSGIAQEIKCDQIQKENSLLQQQVNKLRKGVLEDKEKLVNQLEEIEAGILSREGLCSNLIAEKGQLEEMVRWKDETVSHLNADLGGAQVKQEELQEQLDETTRENVKLDHKADDLVREIKHLSKEVGDFEARETDYKELEKIKDSLQDRLRQSNVEMVGKDGAIQSLNEARDMLQCEVDLVNEAKAIVEKELEDAKRDVAELEAEVKSALYKCREKDLLVRGSVESQNTLSDQQEALLAAKDREIGEKEEVIKTLEDQIGDLVKEFGALQANFESIASESGMVNDSIAEKDRVISHLGSLKDRNEDELGSLREDNQELRDKVAQLQHEKSHLEGQVESAQHEDYQKSLQDKNELQANLNAAKLKHQQDQIKAQAMMNRLEREMKEAHKSASSAQEELQRTRDRNSEDMDKLKEAKCQLQSDVKELEKKLQRSLKEKGRTQGVVVSSSKPSEEHLAVLKANCEELMRDNETITEQLQQEMEQRREIERASGLVAAQLKNNSEKQRKELLLKNREQSLDAERLRGRLVGMQTTQATLREHATNLEATLAKKEADIVKLSAQVQKRIEEKAMDGEEVKTRISAMEEQVKEKQAEVTDCQYKVQDEKIKVEGLEREVAKLKADEILSKKAELSRKNHDDSPCLKDQVTRLSLEQEVLQSDLSYSKSQLLIAKTLADSAKREIADKASQVEILERQLAIAESHYQQADEEVKQLKEHMRNSNTRLCAAGLVWGVAGEEVKEQESSAIEEMRTTKKKRRNKGSESDQLFDGSLSSVSGADDVDHPNPTLTGE